MAPLHVVQMPAQLIYALLTGLINSYPCFALFCLFFYPFLVEVLLLQRLPACKYRHRAGCRVQNRQLLLSHNRFFGINQAKTASTEPPICCPPLPGLAIPATNG